MTDSLLPKRLLPLLSIGLLAVSLIFAVLWLPELLKPSAAQNLILTTDNNCSIKESACTARSGKHSVTLRVAPREIKSAIPLDFQVQLEGIDASAISLNLEGRDMFMGINQVALQPTPNQEGHWQGVNELGACTTGEMVWRARLNIQTKKDTFEAHFDFSAR
ncbi:MAG: hypothetical protein ACPGF7_03555 [Pontibacterium sp.]